MGRYNLTTKAYPAVNLPNIIHALHVVESIAIHYQDNPNVVGIEPGEQFFCKRFCNLSGVQSCLT